MFKRRGENENSNSIRYVFHTFQALFQTIHTLSDPIRRFVNLPRNFRTTSGPIILSTRVSIDRSFFRNTTPTSQYPCLRIPRPPVPSPTRHTASTPELQTRRHPALPTRHRPTATRAGCRQPGPLAPCMKTPSSTARTAGNSAWLHLSQPIQRAGFCHQANKCS